MLTNLEANVDALHDDDDGNVVFGVAPKGAIHNLGYIHTCWRHLNRSSMSYLWAIMSPFISHTLCEGVKACNVEYECPRSKPHDVVVGD